MSLARFALLLPALTVLALAPPARAQAPQVPPLTEAQIQTLYDLGATMHKLPYAEYLATYDKVFDPQFKVNSLININIPGQPPQQARDSQTLAQYKDVALKTYEGLKQSQVSHKITAVIIAADGKSAVVTDTTSVKHARDPDMGDHVFMDMEGSCTDEVSQSPAGEAQIRKSNCVININVITEQEL
jgi:hypothetical protein